jgi:hypothetical protein
MRQLSRSLLIGVLLLFALLHTADSADSAAPLQMPPCCLAAPPSPDERGTAQQPLVVNATLPPKTPEEKAAEQADRNEQQNTDRWTRAIGKATVAILLIQTLVFAWQGWQLRRSVREMNQATRATRRVALAEQQSVETMELTARRELKAYVFVAGHALQQPGIGFPTRLKVTLAVRNFGKTPAYRLRVDVRVFVAAHFGQQEAQITHPVGTLGPDASFSVDAFCENVTEQQLQQVINDQLKVFVFGRVDYEDAFGNNGRWMTFRLMTVGSAGGREPWTKLVACEEGNDSDPPE